MSAYEGNETIDNDLSLATSLEESFKAVSAQINVISRVFANSDPALIGQVAELELAVQRIVDDQVLSKLNDVQSMLTRLQST